MYYLVDTSGRWWRWPSQTLAANLGYPDPDFDLVDYASRNLGYVALQTAEQATFLQFRAGMIGRSVLASLKSYLTEAVAEKPVGLVFYAGGWLEEAYIRAEPLLARLDELASLREPPSRAPFIRKSRQPRDWLLSAHRTLNDMLDVWRFSGGIYSDAVRRCLESGGLMARTIFLEEDEARDIRVLYSGSDFTIYNSFSPRNAIGHVISDQPDRAYGRWVEQLYLASRQSGEPQLDDIDAVITEPGHDLHRCRYQRLILRWRQPDGDILLTGSSMLNQNISIPLDASTGDAI